MWHYENDQWNCDPHPRNDERNTMSVMRANLFVILASIVLLSTISATQQASDPTRLAVDPLTLPTASPKHPYKFQLQVHGGIPPFKYALIETTLPAGMTLGADGLLSGTPPAVGQFRFTVSVSDSGTPAQRASRTFILRVVAPMLMEWKKYARVSGNRVEGSVVVSNSTDDDFDFTFIVLAVAEDGRATAIGYQRFDLKSGVDSLELPFGETLPRGAYMVHVDAVAEVPPKDAIYRSRLQTKEKLPVTVGP
jgi:Putative Ig domain